MMLVYRYVQKGLWAPYKGSIGINNYYKFQCTLYWESSDAAPPSPPPSPDLYTSKSSLMRVKRPATQQVRVLRFFFGNKGPRRTPFINDALSHVFAF